MRHRTGSLWIAGCLAGIAGAATPPAPATLADYPPPTAATIADIRAQFAATGVSAALDESTGVATALDGGAGKVSADGCRQHAAALDAVARHAPLSLAVWYYKNRCALALGDTAQAQQAEQTLAVVLRDTLAGIPPDNGATAIEVGGGSDGTALAYASGERLIYSYFDLTDRQAGPLWRIGLRDDASGHERALAFDLLTQRLRLIRDPTLTRSPALRMQSYSRLADSVTKGDTDSDGVLATADWLDGETAASRDKSLAALAAHGTLSSAIVLARYCVPRPQFACTGKAVDHLLDFAEKGYAEPMLVLAYAYLHARDIKRDPAAAKALLQGAAKKIGSGRAYAEYLRLDTDPAAADKDLPTWLREQLVAAAGKGDALAAGLALQLATSGSAPTLDDARLAALQDQASAAGLGYMVQRFKMLRAYAGHDWPATIAAAKALHAMRAPAVLRTQAAALLGDIYLGGDYPGVAADPAAALQWLTAAGQGGSLPAMRTVGLLYSDQRTHRDSMQLAAEWLSAAVLGNDVDALLALAEIAEHDPPGFAPAYADKDERKTFDAAKAAQIYGEIATAMPGTPTARTARRQFAQLLARGHGIARDPDKARAMLTADAEAGDLQSALLLAEMLYSGRFGTADADGARQWLAKIQTKPDGTVAAMLADRLYMGYELPRDRPRALALWQQAAGQGYKPAWNEMAWSLCTATDAAGRDPAQGLDAARKAIAAFPVGGYIDTLAACQATAGDFSAAVATQRRAMAMVDPRSDTYARMHDRLDLYAAHHIYVQPPPDADDGKSHPATP